MVETGDFEPGPEVPFLAHSDGALHRSYGARSLEGVMPLQRKDALEYELSSCLSSLGESCPSPTRCLRACPICTVITLAVVELLVGVYGILAGLTKSRRLSPFHDRRNTPESIDISNNLVIVLAPNVTISPLNRVAHYCCYWVVWNTNSKLWIIKHCSHAIYRYSFLLPQSRFIAKGICRS